MKTLFFVVFLWLCALLPAMAAGPARVTTLTLQQTNAGIVLSWTAPAPSGLTTLTNLEVKYSTSPITALNWGSTNNITLDLLTDPGTPGVVQRSPIIGLTPGTRYYVALRNQDSLGVWSLVSNVPSAVAGGSTYSITVAWDPNESGNVTSYGVYYGTVSRTYDFTTYTGNVTSQQITGLVWGVEYFIAVTARDNIGLESGFSDEILLVRP